MGEGDYSFLSLLLLIIGQTNGFLGRLPICIKDFRTPTLPVTAIPALQSCIPFGSIFIGSRTVFREWNVIGVFVSFHGLPFQCFNSCEEEVLFRPWELAPFMDSSEPIYLCSLVMEGIGMSEYWDLEH